MAILRAQLREILEQECVSPDSIEKILSRLDREQEAETNSLTVGAVDSIETLAAQSERQDHVRNVPFNVGHPEVSTEQYDQIKVLGQGGMGSVWLVKDNKLNRKVALKALHQRHLQIQENVQNFIEEGQICAQLEHPNICLLYTSPSPRDLSTSRMPSSA